ncbi:MAG: DMT family transporter [Candidatus Peribacteraceae bacterium]|nr:DMT family transporter [Candidatus Peribacteraceae bacterium]
MTDQLKSYLYALAAVLLWGTVPAISKLTLSSLDFYQFTTYSLFFASITLFSLLFFQGKLKLLQQYSTVDYWHMIRLGTVGVFATYMLYFGGIKFSSAADAAILNNTWQMFAILFAVVLIRERLTPKRITAILLGFIGAYVVMTKGSFLAIQTDYKLGYVLALGSGLAEGLFIIWGKKYHYETFSSMAVYCASSFILMLVATALLSTFAVPTTRDLLAVAYVGALGIGLPYVFLFRAMKLGDTGKITAIGYLSPVFALVFAALLLREPIAVSQMIGLSLIMIGIVVVMKRTAS